MYAMGSFHWSWVGRNVGQSVRPKGRSLGFEGILRGLGVFTEDMSRTGETRMGGPSLNLCLVPASRELMSSWSLWAFSAAIASVLDLRGARFDSLPEGCGTSLRGPEEAESSFSMGIAPSTAMSRQVVKVAVGRAENSAGA